MILKILITILVLGTAATTISICLGLNLMVVIMGSVSGAAYIAAMLSIVWGD